MSDVQTTGREITRAVPWFGANAANSQLPAVYLKTCKWVAILFAGSACETRHFGKSVQIVCSDLHSDLITLYKVIQQPESKKALAEVLSKKLFHPDELERAKETLRACRCLGPSLFRTFSPSPDPLEVAEAYFVVCWMGRSAVAGTRGEENVSLALRYDAGGGDPVTRYHSAIEALDAWSQSWRRVAFTCESAFDVLERIRSAPDESKGVYADPPWPDDGDGYVHRFSVADQKRLAKELREMPKVQMCVRFGDHPLIRELYPESAWVWNMAKGRDQDRKDKAEVFLTRRHA